MFTMIVKASSMKDLKAELLTAALHIDTDGEGATGVIQSEARRAILTETPFEKAEPAKTVKIAESLPVAPWRPLAQLAPAVEPSRSPEVASTTSQCLHQYDKRGIPWDERCHASTKAINSDGSWRSKRGMDPTILKQIEASLPRETLQSLPVYPSAPAVPAAPSMPVAQAASVQMPVRTDYQVPSAHTLNTFKAHLIRIMSDLITAKKITQEYAEQLKAHFQVKEFWELSKKEEAVSELFESFVQHGLIARAE